MKIYTKKGDTGETSLIGGTRVPKHHLRIESYGTLDLLNSWIGLLRSQPVDETYIKVLIEIQDRLFTIGSMLASDPEASRMKIPELKEEDVVILEKEIDRMEANLPEMKSFILPGGHTIVAYCHIIRCICRRSERLASRLNESEQVSPLVIKYLNRLSDYFFVLSRMLAKELNAEEVTWKPKM
jgi:cob(I)alamin adenosyltransferase